MFASNGDAGLLVEFPPGPHSASPVTSSYTRRLQNFLMSASIEPSTTGSPPSSRAYRANRVETFDTSASISHSIPSAISFTDRHECLMASRPGRNPYESQSNSAS